MPKENAVLLVGNNFERIVYEEDRKRARIVAFFNDDEENGRNREYVREVWEKVAKEVKAKKAYRDKFLIASIDQSQNEHPETLVPGKLADPMVVFYPPGTGKQRKRQRRKLNALGGSFHFDKIMKVIDDMQYDEEEEEL